MISSLGSFAISSPPIRSAVTLDAIARTRPPTSLSSASRSFASPARWSMSDDRPLTIVGFGGPINRTSTCSVIGSHQHCHWIFDQASEGGKELGPERTVDDTMIAGERHRHYAREPDAAVRGLDRLPARCTDRQNGRVRWIDDGCELAHAVHPEIGDCRRAALIFMRLEPARAGALGELAHFGGNNGEWLAFGLADDRRNQPAIDRDRDANVRMPKAQDPIVRPGGVRLRYALQRDTPCLDDEIVD